MMEPAATADAAVGPDSPMQMQQATTASRRHRQGGRRRGHWGGGRLDDSRPWPQPSEHHPLQQQPGDLRHSSSSKGWPQPQHGSTRNQKWSRHRTAQTPPAPADAHAQRARGCHSTTLATPRGAHSSTGAGSTRPGRPRAAGPPSETHPSTRTASTSNHTARHPHQQTAAPRHGKAAAAQQLREAR